MTTKENFEVAVLELPARWDARDEALDDVRTRLSGARADLVVLPELALTGYVSPRLETDVTPFAETLDGPTVAALSAIARDTRVNLVGPLVLREGGALSNAALLFDRVGELRAVYRKRHPWIPERWATAGTAAHPLVAIEGVTMTIAICYDLHFLPAEADRELDRADLLVFTSAWVDEEDTRTPLLTALARRHRIAIANANWGPGIVRIAGQGGSLVVDAEGAVVARAAGGERLVSAPIGSRRKTHPRL